MKSINWSVYRYLILVYVHTHCMHRSVVAARKTDGPDRGGRWHKAQGLGLRSEPLS